MDLFGEILADEIEHGFMNFFDVPFGSKVVVRGSHSSWIQAGAHSLKHPRRAYEMSLTPSRIRAGHVPLLSRSRIARKARQGQAHIDASLHPAHGWQSQMIYRLEKAGRLEAFWATHSVPPGDHGVRQVTLTMESDDALADALEQSARMLTNRATDRGATHHAGSNTSPRAPLGPAVQAVRFVQTICDAAEAERDAALTERDAAAVQRDVAATERDAAVVQRDVAVVRMDAAIAERDAAVVQRDVAVVRMDAAVAERDAAVAERDAAIAERDAAIAERDSIVSSRTWRWTAWYRRLRAKLRTHLQR